MILDHPLISLTSIKCIAIPLKNSVNPIQIPHISKQLRPILSFKISFKTTQGSALF